MAQHPSLLGGTVARDRPNKRRKPSGWRTKVPPPRDGSGTADKDERIGFANYLETLNKPSIFGKGRDRLDRVRQTPPLTWRSSPIVGACGLGNARWVVGVGWMGSSRSLLTCKNVMRTLARRPVPSSRMERNTQSCRTIQTSSSAPCAGYCHCWSCCSSDCILYCHLPRSRMQRHQQYIITWWHLRSQCLKRSLTCSGPIKEMNISCTNRFEEQLHIFCYCSSNPPSTRRVTKFSQSLASFEERCPRASNVTTLASPNLRASQASPLAAIVRAIPYRARVIRS